MAKKLENKNKQANLSSTPHLIYSDGEYSIFEDDFFIQKKYKAMEYSSPPHTHTHKWLWDLGSAPHIHEKGLNLADIGRRAREQAVQYFNVNGSTMQTTRYCMLFKLVPI